MKFGGMRKEREKREGRRKKGEERRETNGGMEEWSGGSKARRLKGLKAIVYNRLTMYQPLQPHSTPTYHDGSLAS
jgi:hypothetical protein